MNHQVTRAEAALNHLRRAHAMLHPFNAGDALTSPLFDPELDGSDLILSESGRLSARAVRDLLVPAWRETFTASFEFPGESDLQPLVDTAQLTLQLAVAAITAALDDALPSGEAMHAAYRLVTEQAERLELRLQGLSDAA